MHPWWRPCKIFVCFVWLATSQTSIAWGTISVIDTRKCSLNECAGMVRWRRCGENCMRTNCSHYVQLTLLLSRLFAPGLFVHELLPAISYHLFSDTLQRVELSHSQQVDDATLDLLATCGCHPVSIVIRNCSLVTGQPRCSSRHHKLQWLLVTVAFVMAPVICTRNHLSTTVARIYLGTL